MNDLIGQKVVIRENEFVSNDTTALIVAAGATSQSILLELSEPLNYGNIQYRHAVASARSSTDDVESLVKSKILGCSVTWVPSDKYDADNPLNLSWWRGRAAAITDVFVE
ncbi:MAG: hypothetical protein RIG26_09690 [Thalassospira sp.]|uniref:hypothetical protein n=1 Tax=Thalassospira sp. TaxID=1912094 RepID=UPI0032EB9714